MVSDRNAKRRAHRAANLDKYRAYEKQLADKNRDKRNAQAQAWKKANPDKVRASQRKFNFDITQREWDAQFEWQDERCAICRTDHPGPRDWATDHDHATGALRGILCHACNKGIGYMKDSPELLRRAAVYLEVHNRCYSGS